MNICRRCSTEIRSGNVGIVDNQCAAERIEGKAGGSGGSTQKFNVKMSRPGLHRGAIEYFLVPDADSWPIEIRIAEEDLPQAEALLQQESTPR